MYKTVLENSRLRDELEQNQGKDVDEQEKLKQDEQRKAEKKQLENFKAEAQSLKQKNIEFRR